MLVLAKVVMAILLGFSLSVVFGYFVVKIFQKMQMKQAVSGTLGKRHLEKAGTPTMGGVIFIIPTLLIIAALAITGKIEFSTNLFIVLFVFIAYAILGFIDDYLIVKKHNNEGLSIFWKLALQILIALVFFYIFLSSGNDPVVNIHTLGIKVNLGFLYGMFLLFVLVATSNAVNITDGLDGLAGGLSAIAFLNGTFSFSSIRKGSPNSSINRDFFKSSNFSIIF